MVLLSILALLAVEAPEVDEPRLDADQFQARQEAARQLWEGGKESLPTLQKWVESDDPEASRRARRLMRWIDMELTPDSSPRVMELVEAYRMEESMKEREAIFQELLELRAYMPLFRLPRHLSDEAVADNLSERVALLAGQVAREKILEGKDEEALQFLAESRDSRGGRLRYIALAHGMGLKEKLWDKLTVEDKLIWARWTADEETLLKLASPEHPARQVIKIFSGDPTGFLQEMAGKEGMKGLRARLLFNQWQGDEEATTALVKQLVRLAEEGESANASTALQVLGQCGYRDEVMALLDQLEDGSVFDYFISGHEVEQAFKVYGLVSGEPIPPDWLAKQVELAGGSWDRDNLGCRRLFDVAMHLKAAGQDEEAERLIRALWDSFESSEDNLYFLTTLAVGDRYRLLSNSYTRLALELAEEADLNDWNPTSFMELIFGDEVYWLWRLIEEARPDWSEWKRLGYVFHFLGTDYDPPVDEVTALFTEIEALLTEDGGEIAWERLADLAVYGGKMPLAERCWQEVIKLNPDDFLHLSKLAEVDFVWGRYEQALEKWSQLLEMNPGYDQARLMVCACLELCGKKEEAREHWEMLEKLALGNTSWLGKMAGILGQAGEHQLQYKLLRRLMISTRISSDGSWFSALDNVREAARLAGDWEAAASLGEVYESQVRLESEVGYNSYGIMSYFEGRGEILYAKAMAAYEQGEREEGRTSLLKAAEVAKFHGFFANEVLYELNQAGLQKEAELVWRELEPTYERSLRDYPDAHNTLNSIAWVASRAWVRPDDCLQWVDRALKLKPDSAAYLDTRAEVLFVLGKREEALKWSMKACSHSRGSAELGELYLQYLHFKNDDMPANRGEGKLEAPQAAGRGDEIQ